VADDEDRSTRKFKTTAASKRTHKTAKATTTTTTTTKATSPPNASSSADNDDGVESDDDEDGRSRDEGDAKQSVVLSSTPNTGSTIPTSKQHQQQQRARSVLHGIAGDLNASANDDGDDDKTLRTFKAVATTAGVDDSETIQP
jgi:hypothetical protein